MKFQALNLPPISNELFKKSESDFLIYDIIRKKYLVLTPEEWVRQHFLHFLLANKYPKNLISIEGATKYNQLKKRTDILIYDRAGKPFLLVECKAPTVKLNENVLKQVLTYNQNIKAPYIALTNGLTHLYGQLDIATKKIRQLTALPDFSC